MNCISGPVWRNLLTHMRLHLTLLVLFLFSLGVVASAQSQAALDKLAQHYSPAQVEDMIVRTHYKYEALLLFYSASFLVFDDGEFRAANESEIAGVDINHYDGLRMISENVSVQDPDIGRTLLLLSRNAFEPLSLAGGVADAALGAAVPAVGLGQRAAGASPFV